MRDCFIIKAHFGNCEICEYQVERIACYVLFEEIEAFIFKIVTIYTGVCQNIVKNVAIINLFGEILEIEKEKMKKRGLKLYGLGNGTKPMDFSVPVASFLSSYSLEWQIGAKWLGHRAHEVQMHTSEEQEFQNTCKFGFFSKKIEIVRILAKKIFNLKNKFEPRVIQNLRITRLHVQWFLWSKKRPKMFVCDWKPVEHVFRSLKGHIPSCRLDLRSNKRHTSQDYEKRQKFDENPRKFCPSWHFFPWKFSKCIQTTK